MPVGESSFELPLRDLFTRVIPGFVLQFPGLLVLCAQYPGVLDYPALLTISLLVLSLFIGELIDQFRTGPHRVPPSFRKFMAETTENPNYLPLVRRYEENLNQWLSNKSQPERSGITNQILTRLVEEEAPIWDRLKMDFENEFEKELGVEFGSDSASDIFDLLLIHLGPSLDRRSLRSQMDFNLRSNVRLASLISVLVHALYLGNSIITGDFLPQFALAFSLSMLLALTLYTILLFFDRAEVHYTELLFKRYYSLHRELKRDPVDGEPGKSH